MDFLPKDPTSALVEIKEQLYDRLGTLRFCIKDAQKDEYGYLWGEDATMANEIQFLENLLDIIERS